MEFWGREAELENLNKSYRLNKSQLVVLYGRRRCGKSSLVEYFCRNKTLLKFEGIEGERTPYQIKTFIKDFSKQTSQPLLASVKIADWDLIFDQLTKYLKTQTSKKHILFFDEFQWMAAQRSTLVSLLKKYWDQEWKNLNVLLILCGSISSFMVRKVIKSKALYGRVNTEMLIQEMPFKDTYHFLESRNPLEVFNYQLVFGGIPKYWEEMNPKISFEKNIAAEFFNKDRFLFNDYEKIFYSQFKEAKVYEKIIRILVVGPMALDEIAVKTKIKTGGSLGLYLENLILAGFVSEYSPFNKIDKTSLKKYKVTDAYLRFYFKFVRSEQRKILNSQKTRTNFSVEFNRSWPAWAGFAFENFCQKNAMMLAEKMGFADQVISFGPYFGRNDQGFQIDLVYLRSDKVLTICEMKYHQKPISTKIIPEIESKISKIKVPRGHTVEKALVSYCGAEESLKDSQYFTNIITVLDFMR